MRKAWIAVALAVVLSGCAKTGRVDFVLPAPEARTAVPWGQGTGVSVSVSDQRVDRTKIGITYMPWEYVLIANDGLVNPVHKHILSELEARGIRRAEGPAFLLVDIVEADSRSTLKGGMQPAEIEIKAELSVQVVGADGRRHYRQSYRHAEHTKGEYYAWNWRSQGIDRLEMIMGALVREMLEDPALGRALVAAGSVS
jgi:uncharacterized lipoprotein YajG